MITDQLKISILNSAFTGNLSKTLPSDTDISIMMQEIEKKHNKLVEQKVIKLDKKIALPKNNDIPYVLPPTWYWNKLYFVIDVRDGTHDSPKYYKEGIPLVTSKNLNEDGTIDLDNVKFISEDDAKIINNRSKVDVGDILFAMIGSIGNPVVITEKIDFCIKNVALFKNPIKNLLDNDYLYYYLYFSQQKMKKESSGGVQQFVSLHYLRNFYIPLPPIEEQHRIVDKIEEIFTKLDEIKPIEDQLRKIKSEFPDIMKKSILSNFFKEHDVIKKEKLSKILSFSNIKSCECGKHKYLDVKYLRKNKEPKILEKGKYVESGALAILVDGENSGEIFKITENGYLGSTLKILNINESILEKYLIYYLILKKEYFKSNKRGSAIPHLDKNLFFNSMIYLPPLEEQQRIVDKLEQLLPLCDDITNIVEELNND